ncbi:unnamed protein product [Medioppia subpectinata]|uniref:Fatty acyl-CoA reductase n=1 Tax=Medioppia subpectinata TaxID=1979941 RepID=A0A7R9KER5_9ACAR|nr:unnamed protein product [Medioppia subpectinata]CAG2101245.1 unnamed protein product [Medioppia subpectinata]
MTSDICKFYTGKSLFITGATGLLGKALVWKYVNECHGIDTIYILVRPKRGKTAKERAEEYISDPIFELNGLRESGKCDKIVAIAGDTVAPGLGISPADRDEIIANVHIMIHLAASVHLNPPLRDAVQHNLRPIVPLIELCHQMKRLQCLVYSSTTAILNGSDFADEKVHKNLVVSPEYMLKMCDSVSNEVLDKFRKFFFREFNNTYCISKALAEQLLQQESNRLNIVIVRPSAILCAYEDPTPGWLQGIQGSTSAVVAVGLGLMKVFPSRRFGAQCVIPVDFVANGLIASVWFNCKQWLMFMQNKLKIQLEVYLKHWMFAYIVQFLSKLSGIKTGIMKITTKLNHNMKDIRLFMKTSPEYEITNTFALLDQMSETDRRIFGFDIREIEWKKYIENYWFGCRRFILKETDEDMRKAKKIYKKFALVWKYVNECHGIDTIYILVRPKRGKTARERAEEYISDPIFELNGLRESGKCNKIVAIAGDTVAPGLGISPADRDEIIDNVHIVIHLAASVHLNPPLRDAVQHNLRPIVPLIELCHQMKRLQCLVYSSTTAILNGSDFAVETVPKNIVISPEYVLKVCDSVSDEVLDKLQEFFFRDFNNTYCISKALAEQLLQQESNRLNIVIIRPSAVLGACVEPTPGWLQGLQGTTSAAVAIGLGLMNVFPSRKFGAHCVIPVDFVANALITSIWSNCKKWLMFLQDKLKLRLEVYLKHWMFALIMHFLAKLSGIKTGIMNITEKMNHNMKDIRLFMKTSPEYEITNTFALLDEMSETDRRIFGFDIREIEWKKYIENYWFGCRRFILKETDEDMQKAKMIYKRVYIRYHIMNTLWLTFSSLMLYMFFYVICDLIGLDFFLPTVSTLLNPTSIFDSWGHFPVGFMDGTFGALGDFDQCLRVSTDDNTNSELQFVGKYCSPRFELPFDADFRQSNDSVYREAFNAFSQLKERMITNAFCIPSLSKHRTTLVLGGDFASQIMMNAAVFIELVFYMR